MSIPNYKKKYLDEVRPHLFKKFEFTSIMQVPKIEIQLVGAKQAKMTSFLVHVRDSSVAAAGG